MRLGSIITGWNHKNLMASNNVRLHTHLHVYANLSLHVSYLKLSNIGFLPAPPGLKHLGRKSANARLSNVEPLDSSDK